MEADHRTRLQAANLHQVAQLVRQPQAPRSGGIRSWSLAPNQGYVDLTLVADLANQRARVAPNPERASTPSMTHAVDGDLVHGLDEIPGVRGVEAGAARGGGNELPDDRQIARPKGKLVAARWRLRKRSIEWCRRSADPSEIAALSLLGAFRDERVAA
jgi:hypothetical protein